jgi:hypothetical protein
MAERSKVGGLAEQGKGVVATQEEPNVREGIKTGPGHPSTRSPGPPFFCSASEFRIAPAQHL